MARQSFPESELALLCLSHLSFRAKSRNLSLLCGLSQLEIFRDVSTPLDMTKASALAFLLTLLVTLSFAQESPTPSATEGPSPSPLETASASSSPAATVSVAARSIPLRFVPPPMEGTISLGIWDSNDKLVRVLHREAKIDSFTVEENSLSTTWDGKNDGGEDLPAGKYRARGYLIGKLKIDDLGKVASAPEGATDRLSVKLVTNPLVADTRATMEIGIGSDAKGSFLKTTDGLPLATINEALNLTRATIEKNGEKAADVWAEAGSEVEHLRVSNIDKIMAFDCGFFQLK